MSQRPARRVTPVEHECQTVTHLWKNAKGRIAVCQRRRKHAFTCLLNARKCVKMAKQRKQEKVAAAQRLPANPRRFYSHIRYPANFNVNSIFYFFLNVFLRGRVLNDSSERQGSPDSVCTKESFSVHLSQT